MREVDALSAISVPVSGHTVSYVAEGKKDEQRAMAEDQRCRAIGA